MMYASGQKSYESTNRRPGDRLVTLNSNASSRFLVFDANVIVRRGLSETLELGGRGLSILQLFQIGNTFALYFRETILERLLGFRSNGNVTEESGPVGSPSSMKKLWLYCEVVKAFLPVFFNACVDRHSRLRFVEIDSLGVVVGVAVVVPEILGEFDPIAAFTHGPFPGVDYVVGFEPLEFCLIRLAKRADSDAHEFTARLGFVVSDGRFVINKLLHRSHDRVVQLRVIFRKPLSEIFVVFELQTLNHA